MTEKEARLILNTRISRFDHAQDVNEALEIAKQALEEIQQYRAIGTVEEIEQIIRDLKSQIEHSEHLAEVLKSTQNLLRKREQLLKDYCKIGTVEECRAAVERQTPKKPERITEGVTVCPNCGTVVLRNHSACRACRQALDWSGIGNPPYPGTDFFRKRFERVQ